MGTAFHVDGWGGFLTADHVLDFVWSDLPASSRRVGAVIEMDPSRTSHATLLLGFGVVFGTVAVPDWAFAPVMDTRTVVRERDDPLASLRGETRCETAQDVASLRVRFHAEALDGRFKGPKTLPVRLSSWTPRVGDHVLGLGFPDLRPSQAVPASHLQALIQDGLCAAYGRITSLYPEGRDRANPTPVLEIEGSWPSGMSGGPVLNEAGEVIGIVSRALAPTGGLPGVGYAACLPWIPELKQLAPQLDPNNPGFRLGYAVLDSRDQTLLGMWPTAVLAAEHQRTLDHPANVSACANRIGTDDYVRT